MGTNDDAGDVGDIVPLEGSYLRSALSLNNDHATELSFQSMQQFQILIENAFYARWHVRAKGFFVAFHEGSPYKNANFQWFHDRYPRFVYIDRIVIDPSRRRHGFASQMYHDLFAATRRSGRRIVGCEINLEPPNPISDAFHRKLGFTTVGEAVLAGNAKRVRYLTKELP